jgi:SAM-dependent methyltransferase
VAILLALMVVVRRARARLRLRRRFGDPVRVKDEAQLRWWLEQWDPVIRGGGLNPSDALSFLDEDEIEETYLGRRWQLARSQVRRVAQEAAIDERLFYGKVVVELGPGPLGFPDACPARISIGIDPLAERYAQHDLLLPGSRALYLSSRAERCPLLSASADVVLARDTLDYVDDPEQVLAESQRILGPGGTLIVLFDVDHVPNATQPNALTIERVRGALRGMAIARQHEWDQPFGSDGHRAILVAKEGTVQTATAP